MRACARARRTHFTGQVVRIGLESDRVTEERRVYIKGDNPPSRVHLGEQVEFWITVAKLDEALLVPEAAVHGLRRAREGRLDGRKWPAASGASVAFRHRTEDARLEIASAACRRGRGGHAHRHRHAPGPCGFDAAGRACDRRRGRQQMNLAYRDIRHNLVPLPV